MEMVLAEARRHAVIHHHAVILQHQAVAAFADTKLQPAVGVETVQEFGRIGALNVDLAEGGCVQKAGCSTGGEDFAIHRLAHGFAVLRIVPGTHPLADMLECGAVRTVPVIHAGQAHGIEQIADLAAGYGTESRRCVGHPEGGGADLRDFVAEGFGEDGKAIDVGRLALVRCHAERGVALHMLDRLVAFPHCQLHVGSGDVVLVIDKGFRAFALAHAVGDFPGGEGTPALRRGHTLGGAAVGVVEAGRAGGCGAGLHAVLDGLVSGEYTVACAGIEAGLVHGGRLEAELLLVPAELAARL